MARRAVVFLLVSFAWLPFRVTDSGRLGSMAFEVVSGWWRGAWWTPAAAFSGPSFWWLVGLVALVFTLEARYDLWRGLAEPPSTFARAMGQLGFVDAMLVLMVLLGDVGAKEFLYVRF